MNVDRGERAFLEIVSREEEERASIECKKGHSGLCHCKMMVIVKRHVDITVPNTSRQIIYIHGADSPPFWWYVLTPITDNCGRKK